MHDSPLSRRRFLGAAGGLAVWLAASPSDLLSASTDDVRGVAPEEGSPRGYRVLTASQAASFGAFAAQVIPSEPGSPGAREADVARFADNALASFAAEQRPEFATALAALDAEAVRLVPGATTFSGLTASQQIAAMRAMDASQHHAFETLRLPVIAGMFANPTYGGNAGKVGWKLIGFDDRFYWAPPFGFYDKDAEARRHD
jgi:gluconate 2-dehydrogenase gamma chain